MIMFAVAAGLMAAAHVVAALQRPRPAVIVSGILCDANCNIRVDLLLFIPILALATFWAWQSYMGRSGPQKVVGTVFGVIGLLAFGLVAEAYGYGTFAYAVILGVVAIGVVYAIKSRSAAKRS